MNDSDARKTIAGIMNRYGLNMIEVLGEGRRAYSSPGTSPVVSLVLRLLAGGVIFLLVLSGPELLDVREEPENRFKSRD